MGRQNFDDRLICLTFHSLGSDLDNERTVGCCFNSFFATTWLYPDRDFQFVLLLGSYGFMSIHDVKADFRLH